MDERSLLMAKVDALLVQLDWAESSLRDAKVEPRISQAASVGFAELLNQRRTELAYLRKFIPRSGPYTGSWQKLHSCSSSCREFFKECLGFLGGAMLRDLHKENDICEIADALLEDLSRKSGVEWRRVTLLAEAHFFTESTGLIRLPFPDYGIWNLPIAAHELGHFIGPRISDRIADFPFQARLNATVKSYELGQLSEEEMVRELSHLREFFSDLFAVYALGPAYACSCIVLCFDPQDDSACEDSDTHPSHAERVHFILNALSQMSRTSGQEYRKIVKILQALWERNLKSAGRKNCLDPECIPRLNYLLLELYPIVANFLSTVQYKGWKRAAELSRKFPLGAHPAAVFRIGYSIADVLNAAWLWRLREDVENSSTVQRINGEAIALCREIMRRQTAPDVTA